MVLGLLELFGKDNHLMLYGVPRFVVLLDVLASVQISCDYVSFAVCFGFFHRVSALLSYHNVNRSFGSCFFASGVEFGCCSLVLEDVAALFLL